MTQITFLVHRGKEYTVEKFLASWGDAVEARVRVKTYPGLRCTGPTLWKRLSQRARSWRVGALPEAGPGAATGEPQIYIFTDVERLDERETAMATRLWDRLQVHPDTVAILNHPTRSLRRFDLLRQRRSVGTNRFAAYRASENPQPERWPVFVRREDDHGGNVSKHIADADGLGRTLDQMRSDGVDLENTLVIEYCDTSDAQGVIRKYGAFRVGERIVARHIHFSRKWMIRVPDIKVPETLAEERAFVEANPHADELWEIFAQANIEYGRIDYALVDGEIQVWEINTNPMILVVPDRHDAGRFAAHDCFGKGFGAALDALTGGNPP